MAEEAGSAGAAGIAAASPPQPPQTSRHRSPARAAQAAVSHEFLSASRTGGGGAGAAGGGGAGGQGGAGPGGADMGTGGPVDASGGAVAGVKPAGERGAEYVRVVLPAPADDGLSTSAPSSSTLAGTGGVLSTASTPALNARILVGAPTVGAAESSELDDVDDHTRHHHHHHKDKSSSSRHRRAKSGSALPAASDIQGKNSAVYRFMQDTIPAEDLEVACLTDTESFTDRTRDDEDSATSSPPPRGADNNNHNATSHVNGAVGAEELVQKWKGQTVPPDRFSGVRIHDDKFFHSVFTEQERDPAVAAAVTGAPTSTTDRRSRGSSELAHKDVEQHIIVGSSAKDGHDTERSVDDTATDSATTLVVPVRRQNMRVRERTDSSEDASTVREDDELDDDDSSLQDHSSDRGLPLASQRSNRMVPPVAAARANGAASINGGIEHKTQSPSGSSSSRVGGGRDLEHNHRHHQHHYHHHRHAGSVEADEDEDEEEEDDDDAVVAAAKAAEAKAAATQAAQAAAAQQHQLQAAEAQSPTRRRRARTPQIVEKPGLSLPQQTLQSQPTQSQQQQQQQQPHDLEPSSARSYVSTTAPPAEPPQWREASSREQTRPRSRSRRGRSTPTSARGRASGNFATTAGAPAPGRGAHRQRGNSGSTPTAAATAVASTAGAPSVHDVNGAGARVEWQRAQQRSSPPSSSTAAAAAAATGAGSLSASSTMNATQSDIVTPSETADNLVPLTAFAPPLKLSSSTSFSSVGTLTLNDEVEVVSAPSPSPGNVLRNAPLMSPRSAFMARGTEFP